MYTGTYWPKDAPAMDGSGKSVYFGPGDFSSEDNNAAAVEPPSYCVRLLVFSYEDCLE